MLPTSLQLRGFLFSVICLSLLLLASGKISTAHAQTRAYVATCNGTVVVIDTDTNTIITSISIKSDIHDAPFFPAVTPDGTRVYVTNIGNNAVAVIDTLTNTVITSIPVGSRPYMIDITPDGYGYRHIDEHGGGRNFSRMFARHRDPCRSASSAEHR